MPPPILKATEFPIEDKGPGLIARLVKALSPEQVRHSGVVSFFMGFLARTKINYAREIGDKIDSSVVMAPIQWIQRAVPEAKFRVVKDDGKGGIEEVVGHSLTKVMANPNGSYSQTALMSGAILDYLTQGNGIWHAVRNPAKVVVEFWYAPAATMTPKFPQTGKEFITHWEYRTGRTTEILEIEDVIHFRHGLDPKNIRLGLSPLHSVIREIFIDLEASNFSASMLRNMGIPGLMIAPKNDQQMTPEETDATKKWLQEATTGDNRGKPLVMGMPTDVKEFGFSPDKMALSAVRNVAEERVSAVLGIPAAVVGFGTGLEQTKVGATMLEQRKQAWVNGVVPILLVFAEEIGRVALTDEERAKGLRCEFDTTDVLALQDDEKMLVDRWNVMVKGSWATRAEARRAQGLEADDADDVFLIPFSTFEVPRGSSPRALSPGDGAAAPKMLTKGHAASQAGLRYVRQLDQMQGKLSKLMRVKLIKVFEDLGKAAEKAARASLKIYINDPGIYDNQIDALAIPAAVIGFGMEHTKVDTKLTAADEAIVNRILKAMDISASENAFTEIYEQFYLTVAEEVAGVGDTVGLGINLTDPVARSVVAAGGKRAGLVDLEKQTRDALFDALTEGRADGLGADALARKIRDTVGSGPWRTPTIRAKVIARTETKFAQNVATVARAKDAGVEKFVVHDGRLGPGRSSPEHIARDGSVVTAAVAEQMAQDEYPNGTLSFSPFFDDDDD